MDTTSQMPEKTSSNKLSIIGFVVFGLLLAAVSGFAYYQYSQIEQFKKAAQINRTIAITVNDKIYAQFTQVDENAHGQALEACMQIEETKPEYKALVEKGVCDPFSDVFKPDYSAFTPQLNTSATQLNELYAKLGVEQIPDFSDKPTENYIQKNWPRPIFKH